MRGDRIPWVRRGGLVRASVAKVPSRRPVPSRSVRAGRPSHAGACGASTRPETPEHHDPSGPAPVRLAPAPCLRPKRAPARGGDPQRRGVSGGAGPPTDLEAPDGPPGESRPPSCLGTVRILLLPPDRRLRAHRRDTGIRGRGCRGPGVSEPDRGNPSSWGTPEGTRSARG